MSDEHIAEVRLRDLVSTLTSGATPTSGSSRYYVENGGTPFAKIDDLTATSGRELVETALSVNDKALKETALKLYPVGTILLSMYGTIGLTKVAGEPLSANQAIAALIPPFKCDAGYLYHFLTWARPQWERFQAQTTQANINGRIVGDFLVRIPHPREQRRISEILDALEDQIRATEKILLKLELESRATLTVLMTRGPRASQRGPEQAAGISLSQLEDRDLPHGWHLAPIESMLAEVQPAMRSGPFGSALLKHELVSSGVPLLGIDNVHVDRFESKFTRFVTREKARQLSRYLVRPSDIMITIMGTVGRCCVVPEDIGDALSSKHVWTITLDQDRYLPYVACKQLNYAPWARAHLRRDEQGGIMGAIRSETLRSLMLPVPSIEEQREISDILKAIDRRISAESEKLAKLRPLKNGLMSDLLTGRVRVPAEAAS